MTTSRTETVERIVAGALIHGANLSRNQIDLLKRTIAKGASDDELDFFLELCNRTGLDPFRGQIHAIKRWDSDQQREVMRIQVGIDGYRALAESTGKYAGQKPPEWCGKDGKWRDVWLQDEPPVAAKVAVLRCDFAEPMVAVAKFSSYAQRKKDGGLTRPWREMPDSQLAKCAESLALRKAFPGELSGLYTREEMAQADLVEEDNELKQDNQPKALVGAVQVVKGEATQPITKKPQTAQEKRMSRLAAVLDEARALGIHIQPWVEREHPNMTVEEINSLGTEVRQAIEKWQEENEPDEEEAQ